MPTLKVLVSDSIHLDGIKKLKEAGLEVDALPTISKEDLVKAIGEYDALIVRSRTKVTAEVINASKTLKVIGRAGVGLDNVDVAAAEAKGIVVVNTPEAPTIAVAELTMGLLLSLVRAIPRADAAMKEGKWIKGELEGTELRGKTLGIIGFGRIGYQVARRAKAFDMSVLVYDVAIDRTMKYVHELQATATALDALLRQSDFITIHVPLLPETRNLIDVGQFEIMKKGAYIINTSRGGIVNEKSLADALRSGRIAGAALDVFETEPPQEWDLAEIPSTVTTPHIGAQTEESQRDSALLVADKIIAALRA